MRMTFSPRLSIRCAICNGEKHDPNFVCGRMEELAKHIQHMKCPACGKQEVDRNKDDFFECRVCHTQYSRSGADKGDPKRTFLIDEKSDQPIWVCVLREPGRGEFPLDEAMTKLQEEYDRVIAEFQDDDGRSE